MHIKDIRGVMECGKNIDMVEKTSRLINDNFITTRLRLYSTYKPTILENKQRGKKACKLILVIFISCRFYALATNTYIS